MNSAYLSYSRFHLSGQTDTFDLLDQICPKKVFLHILINVSTKFHKLLINYLNLIKSKCKSSCSPCSIAVWKKPQVYLLKKYDWMRHHVNYRNRFQLKRFSVYWTNIHFLSFNKKNCWWFCATQHGLIYQNA